MTYDPVTPIYQSGLDAEQGVFDIQSQIAAMQAQIMLISGMMATLDPMIACRLAVYEMGLIGQQQELIQVALPAQELDVQNAVLNMVTLQQSLYNQLCAGSEGYYNSNQYGAALSPDSPGMTPTGSSQYDSSNGEYYPTYSYIGADGGTTTFNTYEDSSGNIYIWNGDGYYYIDPTTGQGYYVTPVKDSNGKYVNTAGQEMDTTDPRTALDEGVATQTVVCDTPEQKAEYEQTMAYFNECTNDINQALAASFNPNSVYYGWLDVNTANSLWANEQAIAEIIKPTSTDPNDPALQEQCRNFTYQYACYTANPSSPTNPAGDPVNTDPSQGPIVTPDPYPVAQNVQILTQSFNTNISMMNACTQATTGEIKAGTSETQQIYGSVEDMSKSMIGVNQTSVNNERAQ